MAKSSLRINQMWKHAPGDFRHVIGEAPSRYSEACREHQSRHKQKRARKLAHITLRNQPANFKARFIESENAVDLT
jgi:hypothetical protein